MDVHFKNSAGHSGYIRAKAITKHKFNQLDRSILALPVLLGGLRLGNPCPEARTTPLSVSISFSPSHQLLEEFLIKLVQQAVRRVKELVDRVKGISKMAPQDSARTGCMHNLTFVFKCLHNIAPDLFKNYFIRSSHVYSTRRNGLDILIPKVSTESAKNGTFYTGAQAFNNLPPHLKEVYSIVIFKTLLNGIIF